VQNLTNAHFFIDKLFPYQPVVSLPSSVEVLEAVLAKMQQENLVELVGETQIMIVPGYDFKLCKGLITNYHQPSSTLIMLIAAFVGEAWRNIYAEAIAQNYRFLSYGDSSLLWR
jgi:S-adenosylmethionine:tRNA ribosyltransferase-isomerase